MTFQTTPEIEIQGILYNNLIPILKKKKQAKLEEKSLMDESVGQ